MECLGTWHHGKDRAIKGLLRLTKSLAEALPEEINRVRELQDEFKQLRGKPNVIVEPQIMVMEHEIQAAMTAMAQGDVVEMLRWYETLKEYER